MNKEKITYQVYKIFREVFAKKDLVINPQTRPADISNWDSLNHVVLLSKIEQHFQIKFELDDMISFESVEDILNGIEKKLSV